ncbi:MAG: c-type cytochrome, partial [Pusillimonas sp.]
MNNTEEHVEETIEEHEGLIKTPKQLIVTVILAFIVPVIVIVLLVNLVSASSRMGSGSDAQTEEAIANRIKPVAGFHLVDANAPKVFKTGQQVFESTCTACHTAGVAGAPKLGDQAAWAPFVERGYEDMVKNAIHGIGAMPAKGGNPSLSDFEVERAVVYIANQSGASYDEPKEPAGDEAADEAKPAETAAAPAAAAQAEQA